MIQRSPNPERCCRISCVDVVDFMQLVMVGCALCSFLSIHMDIKATVMSSLLTSPRHPRVLGCTIRTEIEHLRLIDFRARF